MLREGIFVVLKSYEMLVEILMYWNQMWDIAFDVIKLLL